MKNLKTPLRYPGGKSKALKKIIPEFPDLNSFKEYREPFLGGGSIAIEVTKQHPELSVWVNDLYWPLYNFWVQLRDHGDELVNYLRMIKTVYNDHSTARVLFESCKIILNDPNETDLMRAVAFWTINKCSFSGLTESSSFSAGASVANFSLQGIENLRQYSILIQKWKITNDDYSTLLSNDKDVFVYLDPPYEISSKLYGRKGNMHRGFDHDKFASDCNRHVSPMVISYNADQSVKDRFDSWRQVEFPFTYTMRSNSQNYRTNQKQRNELLLINY